MKNSERFRLFDTYLESIDGISSAIKAPIALIARYVFEAETGEPTALTKETNVVDAIEDFNSTIQSIKNCLSNSDVDLPLGDIGRVINNANALLNRADLPELYTTDALNELDQLDTKGAIDQANADVATKQQALTQLRNDISLAKDNLATSRAAQYSPTSATGMADLERRKNLLKQLEQKRAEMDKIVEDAKAKNIPVYKNTAFGPLNIEITNLISQLKNKVIDDTQASTDNVNQINELTAQQTTLMDDIKTAQDRVAKLTELDKKVNELKNSIRTIDTAKETVAANGTDAMPANSKPLPTASEREYERIQRRMNGDVNMEQFAFDTTHEPTDPNDIADYTNLDDFVSKVNDCWQQIGVYPPGTVQRANDIFMQIRNKIASTDDINTLDVQKALNAVSMLPDNSDAIAQLTHESMAYKQNAKNNGFIRRQRSKFEDTIRWYRDKLLELQEAAAPFNRIKEMLTKIQQMQTAKSYDASTQADLMKRYELSVHEKNTAATSWDKQANKDAEYEKVNALPLDNGMSIGDAVATICNLIKYGQNINYSVTDKESSDARIAELTEKVDNAIEAYYDKEREYLENSPTQMTSILNKKELPLLDQKKEYVKNKIEQLYTAAREDAGNADNLSKSTPSILTRPNTINPANDQSIQPILQDVLNSAVADAAEIDNVFSGITNQVRQKQFGTIPPMPNYDQSKITTTNTGSFMYLAGANKLPVPLYVAYEMAHNAVKLNVTDENFTIKEEGATKSGTPLNSWYVTVTPNNLDGTISISAINKSQTKNETIPVGTITAVDLAKKALDALAKVVVPLSALNPTSRSKRIR